MTRTALISTLSLVLAAGVMAPALTAQDPGEPPIGERKIEDTPRLTVHGSAELRRPADEVKLSVGVVTENADAKVALQANNDRMAKVIEAITKAGLDESEYETGRFQIRPKYARRPRQPAEDWKPKIVGYDVTNTILVRTKKIDLTGALIQGASQAGANSVEVAGFGLADPRSHRAEAIAEATGNAIDDARALAAAAGLDLVRILHITLDQAPTPRTDGPLQARAMAEMSSAPPIDPGDVTVRASVSIVYEIAPKQ